MSDTVTLEEIDRCLHGIIPGVIATCDRNGTPNVSYISQVHVVDSRHVALSCQFFNKTRQNLDQNPRATIQIYDPITFEAYRLRLHFQRSETEGELFDSMAGRIQAIASHTGMSGIFKLRSADVFEVLSIEKTTDFRGPIQPNEPMTPHPDGPVTELRNLQIVSERVNRARDLDTLLAWALGALDDVFGFSHGMILVPDDTGEKLVTLASHGYGGESVGAEVRFGEGLIGVAAKTRTLLRVSGVTSELKYGRAIRGQIKETGLGASRLTAEIPLPGLADAQSQMAIPLLVQDRLIGVLALECTDALTFNQWHESFLQVLANQIASGIDRMTDDEEDEDAPAPRPPAPVATKRHNFTYYRNDDCVFVDGEYLIRNVPAKILWKVLRTREKEQRSEFSNRELRLDPTLGLPSFKDNLESRLILLRKRLEQKCPDVRLVPTKRGKFAVEVRCDLELVERETA